MMPSTMPNGHAHRAVRPSAPHTRLTDIDPCKAATARTAGRVTDAADRPAGQSVDFNSAV
ncbi:hypothetical protein OHB00_16600 [Streptomyces sp. NBC_00631]|uniref:hypothetical protein n=1 Tax=Streptomyces sp. NBC_00631 TaxID=2975793 RepID=UPI0030E2AD55